LFFEKESVNVTVWYVTYKGNNHYCNQLLKQTSNHAKKEGIIKKPPVETEGDNARLFTAI
jgi:hypothetical protein